MPWILDRGAGTTSENEYQSYIDYSLLSEEKLLNLFDKNTPVHKEHFRKFPLTFWQKRVFGLLTSSNLPFPSEILPIKIKQHTGIAGFPDYFDCCYFTVVSARFKALLENFEPGIHRFEPIVLTDVDRVQRIDEMFILRVGNELDEGIALDVSDMKESINAGKVTHYSSTQLTPRIMWKAVKIEGLHLWTDKMARGYVAVSDAFYAEMKGMNMTGFQAQESRAK